MTQLLPSVEQVQKHLEQTFYKQYRDNHIRDCHVEAILDSVKQLVNSDFLSWEDIKTKVVLKLDRQADIKIEEMGILEEVEKRMTPLPPMLVMESTPYMNTALDYIAKMINLAEKVGLNSNELSEVMQAETFLSERQEMPSLTSGIDIQDNGWVEYPANIPPFQKAINTLNKEREVL